MEYVIGLALAIAVIGATRLAGIERGRNFYPIMLVVVASYYVLLHRESVSRHTAWQAAETGGR